MKPFQFNYIRWNHETEAEYLQNRIYNFEEISPKNSFRKRMSYTHWRMKAIRHNVYRACTWFGMAFILHNFVYLGKVCTIQLQINICWIPKVSHILVKSCGWVMNKVQLLPSNKGSGWLKRINGNFKRGWWVQWCK